MVGTLDRRHVDHDRGRRACRSREIRGSWTPIVRCRLKAARTSPGPAAGRPAMTDAANRCSRHRWRCRQQRSAWPLIGSLRGHGREGCSARAGVNLREPPALPRRQHGAKARDHSATRPLLHSLPDRSEYETRSYMRTEFITSRRMGVIGAGRRRPAPGQPHRFLFVGTNRRLGRPHHGSPPKKLPATFPFEEASRRCCSTTGAWSAPRCSTVGPAVFSSSWPRRFPRRAT
jgi:hypothetical protein